MLACPPADRPAKRALPRILFVEGDVILRHATAEMLRAAGLEVVEAATAVEALEVVWSSFPIDLLLAEIPSHNIAASMAVLGQARTHRPDIKIIGATTKVGDWPSRENMDAICNKPYDAAQLVKQIKGLLSGDGE